MGEMTESVTRFRERERERERERGGTYLDDVELRVRELAHHVVNLPVEHPVPVAKDEDEGHGARQPVDEVPG